MKYAVLGIVMVMLTWGGRTVETTQLDPSKTTYGDRNPDAPAELGVFSFLIGTWQGTGKARLPDGKVAEFGGLSCIGRYVLDGTVIAAEMQSPYPDGRRGLGITLLHYDGRRKIWVVEFVNVSESFIRKQVNAGSGSVTVNGRNVTVLSKSPEMSVREHYLVADQNNFVYRMDVSTDGGRSWNEGQVEMTFKRAE